MKWLGKTIGAIFTLIGFVSDSLMVANWITLYPRFPVTPNLEESINSEVWFFIISTLLAIAGIIIFRKSK